MKKAEAVIIERRKSAIIYSLPILTTSYLESLRLRNFLTSVFDRILDKQISSFINPNKLGNWKILTVRLRNFESVIIAAKRNLKV